MPGYGKSTNISRTNIGSKATSSASAKAAQTSIGSNNSVSTQSPLPSRQSPSQRRPIHPGSRAGLNDHKSTYIQANNSGYMNKSNQVARYRDKTPTNKPDIKALNTKAGCAPKMFDGRLTTSPLSSISRLSKIIG